MAVNLNKYTLKTITGLRTKFPKCYVEFREQLEKPSPRVHDVPVAGEFLDYRKDKETGRIYREPDVPVPVMYPKEANEGLWGGEGIIKGYVKTRNFYQFPTAKYWFPCLQKITFYSEILDKYMDITVTRTTTALIDEAFGFDNYILRTPVQNFKSQLALDLRRQMLLALLRKDFHRDDEAKQNLIYEKYKDCIIPEEEAEWFGLSEKAAITKVLSIEASSIDNSPLKVQFTKDFIAQLDDLKEKGELPKIENLEETPTILDKLKSKLPFFGNN